MFALRDCRVWRPQRFAALSSHLLWAVQFHYRPKRPKSFLALAVILTATRATGLLSTLVRLVVSLYCIRLQSTDFDLDRTRLPLRRKHRSPVKASLNNVSHSNSHHLLGFQLMRSLKSNACAARNRQNTVAHTYRSQLHFSPMYF
jgi:hypothetical protein